MTNDESRNDLERRALELLPWYVNGTLEGEERELVSRQALASLTCRKELKRLRRLQQLIQRDDAEAVATGRAFERLMARIDASGASPRSRARHAAPALAWTRFALAASLAAAVSVLLWWWAAVPSAPPRTYETLTRSQPADAAAPAVRVVFAPGVTDSERNELLASHGLTIVEGPTSDGILTLALPPADDQAAIVAALKLDPRIRLVTSPPLSAQP
jgi:hypothetical protein